MIVTKATMSINEKEKRYKKKEMKIGKKHVRIIINKIDKVTKKDRKTEKERETYRERNVQRERDNDKR